jgi:hypothetical protein
MDERSELFYSISGFSFGGFIQLTPPREPPQSEAALNISGERMLEALLA